MRGLYSEGPRPQAMSRSSLRHEGEALGSGHEHMESDWDPVALWKKVHDSSLPSLLPSPGGPGVSTVTKGLLLPLLAQ